jgi:hypothetical protein
MFHVSSFVETGTYMGFTTRMVAADNPDLPIFTTEIDKKYLAQAEKYFKAHPNITAFHMSSPKALSALVEANSLGELPLFFLDAHWYDYWPLKDEMAIVAELDKFIVVIDDFVVPGRPDFGSDAGGGGSIKLGDRLKKDPTPCDINLIKESVVGCKVAYPTYHPKDVPEAKHFRGYCVISKGVNLGAPDKHHTWEKE